MTTAKKLNAVTLAGLIIGPILGSGLVILPPLLYNETGTYSLIIWAAILTLGFLFAMVFGKLSTLYPGEGGVSLATEAALGKPFRKLTSFYLICAVLFGPVPVAMIAGEFLHNLIPALPVNASALCILLTTYGLLLIRLQFLGKLMLIISSTIAIIFASSAIAVLTGDIQPTLPLPAMSIPKLGHSFLVAFWAIVGWEVIGGYSKEVKRNTVFMHGVLIAAVAVFLIYSLVITAICFGPFEPQAFRSEQLIGVLFGAGAPLILSVVSILLCLATLILFIGNVSRLIASLQLTPYTSRHSKNGIPPGALNVLTAINLCIFALVHFKVFTLKSLVAIADGFFLANAIIGLVTSILLFRHGPLRNTALLLTLVFAGILCFSHPLVLTVIFTLLAYTVLLSRKQKQELILSKFP